MVDKPCIHDVFFPVISVVACVGIMLSFAWLFMGLVIVVVSDGTRYPCRATVNVTSVQYDGMSSDCPVLSGVYAAGSDVYRAHDRPCTDPDVVRTFDITYDPRHPEKYVTLTEVNFRNTGYSDLWWSLCGFLAVLVVLVCAACCGACMSAVDDVLVRGDVQLARLAPAAAEDPEKGFLLGRDPR